jgi:hypothetical protein
VSQGNKESFSSYIEAIEYHLALLLRYREGIDSSRLLSMRRYDKGLYFELVILHPFSLLIFYYILARPENRSHEKWSKSP